MPDTTSRGKYVGTVLSIILLNTVTFSGHNNSVLRLWCSGIDDINAMAHHLNCKNELQHGLYL